MACRKIGFRLCERYPLCAIFDGPAAQFSLRMLEIEEKLASQQGECAINCWAFLNGFAMEEMGQEPIECRYTNSLYLD